MGKRRKRSRQEMLESGGRNNMSYEHDTDDGGKEQRRKVNAQKTTRGSEL